LEGITQIPPLEVNNLKDERETVSYSDIGLPTVIYVFSPDCAWCERNLPNIRALSARKDSFRFIGISLAEGRLKEYLEARKLEFPVYTNILPDTMLALGLGATPQTIVVSPNGKVLKNWVGAYIGQVRSEVESYFGVALPVSSRDEHTEETSRNCVYCVRNGLSYSPGALVQTSDKLIRCKPDGQWEDKN
jgi:hypothetical protein